MITSKDYSYVDPGFVANAEQALSEIRIDADNAWNGVQLKVARIGARVLEESDEAELSFDFSVTNQDPDVAEELENDNEFQAYVGDILVHIIDQAFEKGDYLLGRDDDTDDDSSEPSS